MFIIILYPEAVNSFFYSCHRFLLRYPGIHAMRRWRLRLQKTAACKSIRQFREIVYYASFRAVAPRRMNRVASISTMAMGRVISQFCTKPVIR